MEVERERKELLNLLSLFPLLLPLLLLLLFLRPPPSVLLRGSSRSLSSKPVSQDAEVRSFVYALKSFFFLLFCCSALSLSSLFFSLAAASKKKKTKPKKLFNLCNARSLLDLARSRAAESQRVGPEGPSRAPTVRIGRSGEVEQGRDRSARR